MLSSTSTLSILKSYACSSPEEAGTYVRSLQSVLRALGSSDGNMEKVRYLVFFLKKYSFSFFPHRAPSDAMSIYPWTARVMFRVPVVRLRILTVWSSWLLQLVAIHFSLDNRVNLTHDVSRARNPSSTCIPSGQSRYLITARNAWIRRKYVWNIPSTVQRGSTWL